jgi:glyceraldehyde 3-phosphate dehydrogenase
MARVAINGLGRIGRAVFKIVQDTQGLDLVAVNDLAPLDTIVYLLKFDSVYGRYGKQISGSEDGLDVDGERCVYLSEKDPSKLPWQNLDIDIVLECTGAFTRPQDISLHIQAGARRAILSAAPKGEGVRIIVPGVNHAEPDEKIVSCASCTTNCVTPLVEVMGRRVGIEKAIMTTIHAYTSTQNIVDGPNKQVRRGRAGAANFIPTSTGAAKATTKVLTQYEGKFNGIAVRAPVPAGSISDVVFVTERRVSVEEINSIFREEAQSDRYRDILGVSDEPLVSSDIIMDPRPSIVDLSMTQVVDGTLVKVMGWYDNEWAYASQMVREAVYMSSQQPAATATS